MLKQCHIFFLPAKERVIDKNQFNCTNFWRNFNFLQMHKSSKDICVHLQETLLVSVHVHQFNNIAEEAKEALSFYEKMKSKGFADTPESYAALANIYLSLNDPNQALQVLNECMRNGYEITPKLATVVIQATIMASDPDLAEKAWSMAESHQGLLQTVEFWEKLIMGCFKLKYLDQILMLLEKSKTYGVKPSLPMEEITLKIFCAKKQVEKAKAKYQAIASQKTGAENRVSIEAMVVLFAEMKGFWGMICSNI
jgi:hypothetical protein